MGALGGDRARARRAGRWAIPRGRRALRALLRRGAVPLGLGVYLTFSRGALAALAVGLAVLVPARADARAAARARAGARRDGRGAAASAIALDGVRTLGGSIGAREAAGRGDARRCSSLLMGGARGGSRCASRREAALRARRGRRRWPGRRGGGRRGGRSRSSPAPGRSTGTPTAGADPARLASAQSNRYAYWRVALDAFADHPLAGVGSGGFRVEWLRERDVVEPARDAHSLYLETAAELGLVGLLLLGTAIAGGGARRRGAPPRRGGRGRADRGARAVGGPRGHRLGLGDAGADAGGAGCSAAALSGRPEPAG